MVGLKTKALQLAVTLAFGLLGALGAKAVGLPLPYLLGSLMATAAASMTYAARSGKTLYYPQSLREIFIAVIGTMIGSTFTPDSLSLAPTLAITLVAVLIFVILAQVANFVIFRHIGGYDRATATYAALPGGLIEAVTLGEKAGGDVEVVSIQHFVRIVAVVICVPLLFFIVTGEVVGSVDGQTLEKAAAQTDDWVIIGLLAALGLFVGKRLGLPASPLIGPLVLTAALQASGVVDLQGPTSLLNIAQLVVGASLGARFGSMTPRRLALSFGLGLLSVAITLMIASGLALAVAPYVPMAFKTLLISFAPGGVTEMSLVALSLGVSPVLVSTHHLCRILFTVGFASLLAKYAGQPSSDS